MLYIRHGLRERECFRVCEGKRTINPTLCRHRMCKELHYLLIGKKLCRDYTVVQCKGGSNHLCRHKMCGPLVLS